ncbi:cytochrome b561 [Rhizomicrobium palustre]|uniref:Cytochrome b561 n=1 Tax=Rhizomicrobium palustre TaxID=189966 RepID=A0A846N4B4_9PROT|nr:cytochrome b/b6 domain-containing protein [Rhizomicrobium palustre]NIK90473.1 cytochrome b561 [Rhizomicrobium palustre]
MVEKYARDMRVVHWARALVVLGVLALGVTMVNLPDDIATKYEGLYPNHKQFGLLALLLTLLQLGLRQTRRVPEEPQALKAWERKLSSAVHHLLYVLLLVVPVMGYCMSSSFSQSDGVPFFFFGKLPELLAKNDAAFEVFRLLHRVLAYTLLALVALHIAGALKHRLIDKDPEADVLKRML